MEYKNIISHIKILEEEYKEIKTDFKALKILNTKHDLYLKEDKESFIIIWKKYISFFLRLQKLIKKTKHKTFFFKTNYTRLVLKRYLLIFYLNVINDLIFSFGKHEKFIRLFLADNFKKDYGMFAKYIYRPVFMNIINTPAIFLEPFKLLIKKDAYKYLNSKTVYIKKTHRFFTDYQNIYYYIRNRSDKVVFSILKSFGMFISKIKFSRRKRGLITQKNLDKYLEIARPGDIMLTRGNWNATNVSIPGFWKHMSLYLGTGKYLKNEFIEFQDLEDKTHYIIEAIGEGIFIKPIADLVAHNDYLGVSRTHFSDEKIHRVLKSSFKNIGKGYDFIFNYYSDKNLVCSELVMKSFAKEKKSDEGIDISLENIGISLAFPPNNFIQLLMNQSKKEKPDVFPLFFIDCIEKTGKNFIGTSNELLESGSRSRFSFFQK